MNVLAYSPDGQLVVTGGDDGKVVGLPLDILKYSYINSSEHRYY